MDTDKYLAASSCCEESGRPAVTATTSSTTMTTTTTTTTFPDDTNGETTDTVRSTVKVKSTDCDYNGKIFYLRIF